MWMKGQEPTLEDAKELCEAVNRAVGKPTLSEVLAEIDKKAFWDYIPRRSVPMKAVEEVLRKYFA